MSSTGRRRRSAHERASRTRRARTARVGIGASEVRHRVDPVAELVLVLRRDAHAASRSPAAAARGRRRRRSRSVPRRQPRRGSSACGARRSSSSDADHARGVNPVLTSRRIRWWRGSSIMLSTTPATVRSSIVVPPYGRPPPVSDENVCGSRKHAHHVGVPADHPEPLAVGRVLGRRVPLHRCIPAQRARTRRAGTPREPVEVREVHLHDAH